ncbi:muscle, skeletal receptor tyrosine-protein kinase-like isoform X1, partial [Clarias magur]
STAKSHTKPKPVFQLSLFQKQAETPCCCSPHHSAAGGSEPTGDISQPGGVQYTPGYMASDTLLIFVLMLSSVRLGKSAETLFNLKCQSAVGIAGQTTNISCSIESQTGPVVIKAVSLTRIRENKPCFTFKPSKNRVTGDSRFKVESLPSLQLHNTSISDEGGYRYYIRTNLGHVDAEFTISVVEIIKIKKSAVKETCL